MKKLEYIEIARGIAAILVVLHHATLDAPAFYGASPFSNFFLFGSAGVDFFFVLSGFIIYYVHSNDDPTLKNIKRYIIKRLIRVYPIFLFVSVILLSAYLILPQWSPKSDIIDFLYLSTSFFLLPSQEGRLLSVSWTLVHEMFFYMAFILMILNQRIGTIVFILWGVLILMTNLFFHDVKFPISFYLSQYNLEFLFGVTVAFLIKSNRAGVLKKYPVFIALMGVIVFLLNGINVDYSLLSLNSFFTTMIFGFSASAILFGSTLLDNPKKQYKILLLLGAASYSIYLIHNPLQSVLHRIIRAVDLQAIIYPNIIFISIAILCVLAGIILHLWIEKPLLRYLRKRFL